MSVLTIGILGIIVMILFFLIGMPIAFAMMAVGIAGFCFIVSPDAGLTLFTHDMYETFTAYVFTPMPMFILMGAIVYHSGTGTRLYKTSHKLFGQMRGGLVFATIFAGAGFAAMSGSSNANAAAMGKIALPEMKKFKYADSIATGSIASSSNLGILIPPSGVFIVYAILTELHIGDLFIAGVIPGVVQVILFAITVYVLCLYNPALGPPGEPTTWREKIKSLTGIIETLILFFLVIGGIFFGWFSPTQAGAAGAAGAIIIGVIRRELKWDGFIKACKETLRFNCMILGLLAGAMVFGHFMAVSKIPMLITDWIMGLPLPNVMIMGVILIVFFLAGCFMDSFAMMVLSIPIIFPAIIKLGYDPVWFGVIMVITCEMGAITPPLGINVFIVKEIADDVPVETVFKGVLPFALATLVLSILLFIFPQIATYLPGLINP